MKIVELDEGDVRLQKIAKKVFDLDLMIWPKYLFTIGFFGLTILFSSGRREIVSEIPLSVLQDKLAVLYFDNQTGDESLDVIGPMVSHWLTEGFIQNGDVKIVSANSVQRVYSAGLGGINGITENISKLLGTKTVIDGSYFLQGDSIFIKANLINVETGDVLYAFGNFAGPKEQPIAIIEDLREKVLGYWFNKDNIKRYPAPRYDAFTKYIEAQRIWSQDDTKVKLLLEESIKLDPNFYEPKFLLVALFRNKKKWDYCDSLISEISANKSKLTEAQLDKYKFFRYELAGDYKSAYSYLKKEYDRDPQDLFMNTSLMHFANFNLNASKECLNIAQEIAIDSLDLEECEYCKTRLFNQAQANFNLGNIAEFERLVKLNTTINPDRRIQRLEIIHLVNKDKYKQVTDKIQEYSHGDAGRELTLSLVAAVGYLRLGKTEQSKLCLAEAKPILARMDMSDGLNLELVGQFYEMTGLYNEALETYTALEKMYSGDRFALYRMACCLIAQGKTEEGLRIANGIESAKGEHDFGYTEYEMARVYLLLKQPDKALDYLEASVNNGRLFHPIFFEADWYFQEIWNHPRFKALMKSRLPE